MNSHGFRGSPISDHEGTAKSGATRRWFGSWRRRLPYPVAINSSVGLDVSLRKDAVTRTSRDYFRHHLRPRLPNTSERLHGHHQGWRIGIPPRNTSTRSPITSHPITHRHSPGESNGVDSHSWDGKPPPPPCMCHVVLSGTSNDTAAHLREYPRRHGQRAKLLLTCHRAFVIGITFPYWHLGNGSHMRTVSWGTVSKFLLSNEGVHIECS